MGQFHLRRTHMSLASSFCTFSSTFGFREDKRACGVVHNHIGVPKSVQGFLFLWLQDSQRSPILDGPLPPPITPRSDSTGWKLYHAELSLFLQLELYLLYERAFKFSEEHLQLLFSQAPARRAGSHMMHCTGSNQHYHQDAESHLGTEVQLANCSEDSQCWK